MNYTATKLKKGEWLYRGYKILLKMNQSCNGGGRFTYWEIEGKVWERPSTFQQLGDARKHIDKMKGTEQ